MNSLQISCFDFSAVSQNCRENLVYQETGLVPKCAATWCQQIDAKSDAKTKASIAYSYKKKERANGCSKVPFCSRKLDIVS